MYILLHSSMWNQFCLLFTLLHSSMWNQFACYFPYIKATSLPFDLRPGILNESFVALIDWLSPTGSGLWKGLLDTSRNQLGTCNPVIAVMAWFVTITTMVRIYALVAGMNKMVASW